MPMNIQINEAELQHLVATDLEGLKLAALPVKNIKTDISERTTEQSEEIMYIFYTPGGNMVFKKKNDQFQVSSVTGDQQLVVFRAFCRIADQNDINYTSIGFEPFA